MPRQYNKERHSKGDLASQEDKTLLNSPSLRSFSLPGRSGSPGGGGGMVCSICRSFSVMIMVTAAPHTGHRLSDKVYVKPSGEHLKGWHYHHHSLSRLECYRDALLA
ncbi:hypothetical protein E2C01_009901 [Portunus trituberculatus]|uniref:Uncharacterized protein n=1 Tax=Portunus trituberculatus TaxID=210409 RepID=A0A5B7D794_PORTR|nr:hypothetical protein [Portunus trituberculatus]